MNNLKLHNDFEREIFDFYDFNISTFEDLSLELFRYQYQYNRVYNRYVNTLGVLPANVNKISEIPFLPINLFKTHQITTTEFIPEVIFESSGTTQSINSKHYVKNIGLYRKSFTSTFKLFYGDPSEWCILGLLPSYLERKNSSLVAMTEELIGLSGDERSGFYLDQFDKLKDKLIELESAKQNTLLIGVTFALLEFAEKFPTHLHHTIVMETGGMKGRKEEITREEVHDLLRQGMGLQHVHSEYGMTELLSQAYSRSGGLFYSPPWMRVLLRSEDDPFSILESPHPNETLNGVINVIDLVNIYSCAFLATDDIGKLHHDGGFEVLGRMDNSDIRGCSLMF